MANGDLSDDKRGLRIGEPSVSRKHFKQKANRLVIRIFRETITRSGVSYAILSGDGACRGRLIYWRNTQILGQI
jgi:hypothetical protein